MSLCRMSLCRMSLCRMSLCRMSLCRMSLCRMSLCRMRDHGILPSRLAAVAVDRRVRPRLAGALRLPGGVLCLPDAVARQR
jgi:hypothetical protein